MATQEYIGNAVYAIIDEKDTLKLEVKGEENETPNEEIYLTWPVYEALLNFVKHNKKPEEEEEVDEY